MYKIIFNPDNGLILAIVTLDQDFTEMIAWYPSAEYIEVDWVPRDKFEIAKYYVNPVTKTFETRY